MTVDLQTAINQSVSVVDLGDKQYTVEGTAILPGGKTIGGMGASIVAPPVPDPDVRPAKSTPALALRGDFPRLTGRVWLKGPMPSGGVYDATREVQHAIEVDGATGARIDGWRITNFWGDLIYVGTTSGAHDPWTTDLRMWNLNLDQAGRHSVTLDAVNDCLLQYSYLGRSSLSPVDVEPPGGSWGCRRFRWSDCVVTDRGGGYLFANGGVGGPDTVQDITIARIKCPYRYFNGVVNPDPKRPEIRRQRYRIFDCEGAGTHSGQEPWIFRKTDGIYIRRIKQACGAGIKLVKAIDCTNIDSDVPVNTTPG